MAQVSYPNSAHNSRAVTEAEFEKLVEASEAVGIIGSPAQTAVIYADNTGRLVKLRANKSAQVRGFHWDSGSTETNFALAANAGATRLDLIVLRLTRSTWVVEVAVVTGVSGSPAPAPTQDLGSSGVYELALAVVTVPNGATSTTAGQVSAVEVFMKSTDVSVRDTTGQAYVVEEPGRIAYRDDDEVFQWNNGTDWRTFIEWTTPAAFGNVAGWNNSSYWQRVNGIVTVWVETSRSGANVSSGVASTLATLPAGARPSRTIQFAGYLDAGRGCALTITTAGVLSLSAHNGANTSVPLVGSVSFPAGN